MKPYRIYRGGSDGVCLSPRDYSPKAETAPESFEWWLAQTLLKNTEAQLPKSRTISEAIQKMRQRLDLRFRRGT